MTADVDKDYAPPEQESVREAATQDDELQVEETMEPEAAKEVPPEEVGAKPIEDLERVQGELDALTKQADEYLDQWRRTAAEFSNYRKRIEREQAEFARQANARLIRQLLSVLDDFERAFATIPNALIRLSWIEGLALIHRKLLLNLEAEGVEAIETSGKDFDPLEHEAVTYETMEGHKDGQIIGEIQRGYRLADRVLRPALVRVAQAPVETQPPAEMEEPSSEEQPPEEPRQKEGGNDPEISPQGDDRGPTENEEGSRG